MVSVSTTKQQYKKATLFFSQDSATIATVILVMDKLDNKINRQTKQPLHAVVVSAMQLAKNKIDRYSRIYQMSITLLWICSVPELVIRHIIFFLHVSPSSWSQT